MLVLELFIKDEDLDLFQKVDLFEFQSIQITDTIKNIRDIKNVFTAFTQQFSVPFSKGNNKILKHYHNSQLQNGFDARFKVDALLKLNGADYKKGKIRLNSVSFKNGRPNSYQVVFFGETVKLKELLGNDKLDSLDALNNHDHDYDNAIVKGGLVTGIGASQEIIYPLITHTIRYFVNGAFQDKASLGLNFTELKPAIKIKTIIEAIELKYGIIFSDDFFNTTTDFNDLYLWLSRNKGNIVGGEEEQTVTVDFSEWVNVPTITTFGSITIANEDPDHIIQEYDFNVTIVPNVQGAYSVKITAVSNDNDIIIKSFSGLGTQTFIARIRSLATSKTWEIDVEVTTFGGITSFTTTLDLDKITQVGTGSPNTFTTPHTTTPPEKQFDLISRIVILSQIPKMKVIDFLTSLFKMFNLVAFVEADGKIAVKTLDKFHATGNDRDITKFTQITKVTKVLQNKRIEFKYKEAKTILAIKRNELTNEEFGNLDFDSEDLGEEDDFDGGVLSVPVKFGHMLYERLINADNSSPTEIQLGFSVDEKQEPVQPNPLIFYNVNTATASPRIKWIEPIGASDINTYNRPSNVSPSGNQTLNFGAEIDEFSIASPIVPNTNSLFENFYKTYITNIFNIQARLVFAEGFLPLSIVLDLSLADVMIIAGVKHRINSIKTNLKTGKSSLELITIV